MVPVVASNGPLSGHLSMPRLSSQSRTGLNVSSSGSVMLRRCYFDL